MAHALSIENPLQIRSVRRTIARLATELTKRELQSICRKMEEKEI
jgi:large subunit ribosomal protein L29